MPDTLSRAPHSTADLALIRLGRLLRESGYQFVTITPDSHARVNARSASAEAHSPREVFGWSRPFERDLLPPEMFYLLREAEAVDEVVSIGRRPLYRSKVRFSSDQSALYVHSAFPTTDGDAVFFGPDTYRYLALLRRLAPEAERAVDIGCGSGAGGISIAARCEEVILADINEIALRYAAVNAAINGVGNALMQSSNVLREISAPLDLVISNPPYLVDQNARLYRDGGGRFGEGLSIEIVRQALERLPRGGRLILYTATAVVDGQDTFLGAVKPLVSAHQWTYEELDPDVFGEELSGPAYEIADRLAVVAMDVHIT